MYKCACAAFAAVLLSGVAALGGCAATGTSAVPDAFAAAPASQGLESLVPQIAVPPASVGVWYDLGVYQAPWLAGDGPVPVAGPNVPTHVVGWKREAGSVQEPRQDKTKARRDEWLAIVIVQAAPGAHAPCPAQASSLDVPDAGSGCLRMRRDADFDYWMQAAQPALYRWVDEHGWSSRPRAWTGYRLPSAGSRAIEVHVLFSPSLIEPTARNTSGFLTGGLPGQQWARQLAAAVRAMDGVADSVFAMPPFPFAPGPHVELEAVLPDALPGSKPRFRAPVPVAATVPAVAEQVMHMPLPESQPGNFAPGQDGN